MNGDYDDPDTDDTQGAGESLDLDDVRNDDGDIVVDQSLTHFNWHKAIIRDIDALVELKRLRRAL